MMQRTTRLPCRLRILACMGAGVTLSIHAEHAALPLADASTPLNLVTACAVLLAALVLLLLWRQRRLAQRIDAQYRLRAQAEPGLLERARQTAREQERLRIGRDIHDDLGQHLLTLKIDLAMLQSGAHGAPALLRQKLALISHNVDLSIAALRCVIHDLRPPALEGGLHAAFEGLQAEFSRSTGIACECACEFDAGTDGQHDALLYHVLQEALANIARHARATRVMLRLRCDDTMLQLSISDDGVGMPAVPRRAGCGLAGMQERLAAAGGSLSIDSRAGGGTTLRLSLPLAAGPA